MCPAYSNRPMLNMNDGYPINHLTIYIRFNAGTICRSRGLNTVFSSKDFYTEVMDGVLQVAKNSKPFLCRPNYSALASCCLRFTTSDTVLRRYELVPYIKLRCLISINLYYYKLINLLTLRESSFT